jgi:hypothetical protein
MFQSFRFSRLKCFALLAMMLSMRLFSQSYRVYFPNNPLEVKYASECDSLQLTDIIYRVSNMYLSRGYLAVNTDSIVWGKKEVSVFLFTGEVYTISKINVVEDSGKSQFNYLNTRFSGSVFDTLSGSKMAESVLNYMDNSGYPFCKIQVKPEIDKNKIQYNLSISSGPYFAFDTSHIDGDQVLNKRFLAAYTGIKPGTAYNELLFRKAHEKLNQLPFLISERTPQMVFIYGGKARPYYYLKKRASDQINGIIGLAPTTGSNTQNRVVFTGEFMLRLNNLFKSAKMLSINWRSFKARSQELKTAFNYPYIFGKPVGVDLALDFIKFDTLYTTFQRQIGLQYYTSGINGFKFFYQVNSTNLNSVDTNRIRQSKQFPSTNAVEIKQYGITAAFNLLDNRYNPLKGYFLDAVVSAGTKNILRDNQISEVKFGSNQYTLYDSNTLKNTQFQIKLRLDKYIPLGSNTTLKLGFYSSQISAPRIYFNELLREGGINSLKGFNEQSIFASNFNMLEVEFRYLIGQNSHIKAFWNGAYYEDRSFGRSSDLYDKPWGFGIGGNIETGAGVLSLAYALGKEKGNGFDLRTGKVHFGLSSYF